MLKVRGSSWQTVDGVPSIVFRSLDVRGNVVEIAVPLAAFVLLGNQAKTRLSAAEFAAVKASGPPQWHHANFQEVRTMTVGSVETTEPRRVGLILDRDLDSELSLSFDPSHARELGEQLRNEADQVEGEQDGSSHRH